MLKPCLADARHPHLSDVVYPGLTITRTIEMLHYFGGL
jgi:hypothetical protein